MLTWCIYSCVARCVQAAGCDGVMGSSRQADRCGVCDGDHTSCMVISDNVVVNLTKRGEVDWLSHPIYIIALRSRPTSHGKFIEWATII